MDNEVTTLSIVIGISSSLIATAIFIIASETFRKIVLPWYADKIYRDIRIDGDWIFEGEDKTDICLSLKQWGNQISGTYCHEVLCNSKRKLEQYKLCGTVRNSYFMATIEPESQRAIDAIVLLVHIEEGSEELQLRGSLLHKGNPGEVRYWDQVLFKPRGT